MPSPTIALLWEIWRRHRWAVAAIVGLTVTGRLVSVLDGGRRAAGAESSPLPTLLAMLAFLLLLSVFNYTDSSGGRGLGQFPRRLFTLPVTSLRLVTVPTLAGIASIELLFLLWMEPLSRGGSARVPFVAVLLAAFVMFYLWALWTLERAGSLRLVILGVLAIGVFAIGILPSFPPNPPPSWRSEIVLSGVVTALAVVAFLLAWRHVAQLRTGGRSAHRAGSAFRWIAATTPARRRAFANPAAAHFWFEWQSSGMVLPALVGGVLIVVVMPMSWLVRSSGDDTFRLVLAALAAPAVLAVPVGMAFSKPTFWSEDLAVPAFIAIRPLSAEDVVASKMKVAAVSAALSWLAVVVALMVWLPSWGNLDTLSQLAVQLWAFHGFSVVAVYGTAVLMVFAGMSLTWRFLVSRLWSGLSGVRALFVGSVLSTVMLAVAGVAFDAGRLPRWVLGDPARLGPLVWIAAIAVIAKYWMAAHAWRGVSARSLRTYLPIWLAGTGALLALGIVAWGVMRIYLPLDVERLRSIVILLALLAVPLARVGLAPSSFTRNRHQ